MYYSAGDNSQSCKYISCAPYAHFTLNSPPNPIMICHKWRMNFNITAKTEIYNIAQSESFQFCMRCQTRNSMHWIILKSLVKSISNRCKTLCAQCTVHNVQCEIKSFQFQIKSSLCAFCTIWHPNLLRTMCL